MPKADEEQRAARSAALVRATLGAAAVPLETLTAARETLDIAATLAGRANAAAASDLGVAVHLARTAAEGALLNVAINLASLPPGEEAERLQREKPRRHQERACLRGGGARRHRRRPRPRLTQRRPARARRAPARAGRRRPAGAARARSRSRRIPVQHARRQTARLAPLEGDCS